MSNASSSVRSALALAAAGGLTMSCAGSSSQGQGPAEEQTGEAEQAILRLCGSAAPGTAPNGSAFNNPACCASGFSVDGVCCDTACGSSDYYDCQACSVRSGAAVDGTCGPIVCLPATACQTAGVCIPGVLHSPVYYAGVGGYCSSSLLPDGTACSDGDACTSGDTCQAGACTSGAPVSCAPADQCHAASSCDPSSGSCTTPAAVADGTPCDDADVCTRGDTCQAGLCTGAAVAAAPTCIVIQRGTSGTVDDALIAGDPTKVGKTYGSSVSLTASNGSYGAREALVHWDLSAIPSTACVTSATVSFDVLLYGGVTVEVHRATASWDESTVSWSTFNQALDATLVTTLPGTSHTSASIKALAQSWVTGAAPNDGIALVQPADAITVFHSSEVPTVTVRPRLDICYVP
jgi:hypothetical protein